MKTRNERYRHIIKPNEAIISTHPNLNWAAYFSPINRNKNYTGPCMIIGRTDDAATLSIPYKNNNLIDWEAILSFIGTGDAFVMRHYDSSGAGLDAVQSTKTNAPRIAIGGVIQTINDVPAMVFGLGGITWLTVAAAAGTFPAGLTAIGVMQSVPPIGTFDGAWWTRTVATASARPLDQYNATRVFNGVSSFYTSAINLSAQTSPAQITQVLSTTGLTEYKNGKQEASTTVGGYSDTASTIEIGTRIGAGTKFSGKLGELGFIKGVIDAANRTDLEATLLTHYKVVF